MLTDPLTVLARKMRPGQEYRELSRYHYARELGLLAELWMAGRN